VRLWVHVRHGGCRCPSRDELTPNGGEAVSDAASSPDVTRSNVSMTFAGRAYNELLEQAIEETRRAFQTDPDRCDRWPFVAMVEVWKRQPRSRRRRMMIVDIRTRAHLGSDAPPVFLIDLGLFPDKGEDCEPSERSTIGTTARRDEWLLPLPRRSAGRLWEAGDFKTDTLPYPAQPNHPDRAEACSAPKQASSHHASPNFRVPPLSPEPGFGLATRYEAHRQINAVAVP